jgi:hypothetical protein
MLAASYVDDGSGGAISTSPSEEIRGLSFDALNGDGV